MGTGMPGVSGNSETRDPDIRGPLCPLSFGFGQERPLFLTVLYLRRSFTTPPLHAGMVKLNTQIISGVEEKAINRSRPIFLDSLLFIYLFI